MLLVVKPVALAIDQDSTGNVELQEISSPHLAMPIEHARRRFAVRKDSHRCQEQAAEIKGNGRAIGSDAVAFLVELAPDDSAPIILPSAFQCPETRRVAVFAGPGGQGTVRLQNNWFIRTMRTFDKRAPLPGFAKAWFRCPVVLGNACELFHTVNWLLPSRKESNAVPCRNIELPLDTGTMP